MGKTRFGKRRYRLFVLGIIACCVVIYGCITQYEATGVEGLNRILVVEGFITDDITTIRLSKSIGLSERFIYDTIPVDQATLHVACDDGTVYDVSLYAGKGTYLIETGHLNPDKKYRLHVFLDGEEYRSEFLKPLFTPDFNLSWVKKNEKASISFQVSTLDSTDQSAYYLWSYKEDWEFTARLLVDSYCLNYVWVINDITSANNYYYCWKKDSSRVFILGNADGMIAHEINNYEILSVFASDERLSLLYHIAVKQNMIRKEAYTYYVNLQKNLERVGGIFSIIPSEVPGNLYCHTSPRLPVIGYVEVSTTVEQKRYIRAEEAYVPAINYDDCLMPPGGSPPPECSPHYMWKWAIFDWSSTTGDPRVFPLKYYYNITCMDCLAAGGTKDKPEWWPTDHL